MTNLEEILATVLVLFCIGITFLCGGLMGADIVHDEWRKDAIERCSKTHGLEWCNGRAVLEKW